MTDPREQVRDARARLKTITARLMVQEELAAQELEKLRGEHGKLLQETAVMRAAGREDLAESLTAAADELDGRVDAASAELGRAEAAVAQALEDAQQLERDEGELDRARLRDAQEAATRGAGHELSLDPADIALRNVREHAQNLDARVELERDLAPKPPSDPEADARAQLAALKEARNKKRTL